MKMLPLAAAAAAVLAAAGCETSNQDYTTSAQVIDVTARPGSVPTVYTTAAPAAVSGRTATAGVNGTAQSYSSPDPQAMQGGSANLYDEAMVPLQGQVGMQAVSGTAPQGVSIQSVPPNSRSAAPVTASSLPPDQALSSPVAAQGAAEPAAAAAPASTSGGAGVVMPYSAAVGSSDTYTVVRGDTLYSIAFRYGLDYRALAAQNGIAPPYNISVGQVLQLNRQASAAPTYTVRKGDTLFSIAKKHGQSVPFLAGVNDLTPPYSLNVGQVLYLARQDSTTTANRPLQAQVPVAGQTAKTASTGTAANAPMAAAPAATTTGSGAAKSDVAVSTTTVLTKPVIVSGATRQVGGVTWTWPSKGSIVEGFSRSEQGNKGIDIAGNRGQQVLAAADGQVVYAGNALRGYGNLIIINHANEYLSAYAHNEVLQVTEGQSVKRGQQIARMGSTDAKSVRLHFEIRYRGQSVNPLSYLPK